MYFPKSEYEERWTRLDAELERLGYDVALIWQRTGGGYDRAGDVWYLTNYASAASGQEPSGGPNHRLGRSFAALIVRRGSAPELHILEPKYTVDLGNVAVEQILDYEQNLPSGVAARLTELGVEGRVAHVGDDFLPVEMSRILETNCPDIELCSERLLVHRLQSEKSALELDLFREAGAISAQALTRFMEALLAGERQCDAAAKAAATIVSSGGGFQRLGCHTGPASENQMWDNPLYGYSERAAEEGDMVRAWVYGPIREGYWLDPGRTSVRGRPSPAQKKLIEDGVRLTLETIESMKPGMTPREVGAIADRRSASMGYADETGGAIWDIYGHSLGAFWLEPYIPANADEFDDVDGWWGVDEPLHENQVLTVETFLNEPGIGTSTFEQIFILGADDQESIVDTPMLFW